MRSFLLFLGCCGIVFCDFAQAQGIDNAAPKLRPFVPAKRITKPTFRLALPRILADSGAVQYALKEPIYTGDPTQATLFLETTAAKDTSKRLTNGTTKYLSLRGGLGNYRGTYLEADWAHKVNPRLSYTVYARHQGWGKGAVAEDLSAQNQQNIRIGATYNHNRSQSRLSVGFTRSEQYFYGTIFDFPPRVNNRNDIQQNFYKWDIQLSHGSTDANKPFAYRIDKAIRLTDNFAGLRERLGTLNADLRYILSDTWTIRTGIEGFLSNLRTTADTQDRFMAQVRPTIQYQRGAWDIRAGFNLGVSSEDLGITPNWGFAPVLSVDYHLSSNHSIYALVDGSWQRNTLYDLSAMNPWLNNGFTLLNTKRVIEYTLGWRGRIAKHFIVSMAIKSGDYAGFYNIFGFGIQPYEFVPLFSSFDDVIYINRLNLQVEYRHRSVSFRVQQEFIQGFDMDFYTLVNYPASQTKALLKYRASPRLSLEANYLGLGGINPGGVISFNPITLPYIADIGLRGEYKLFKQFSTYLSAQNLLNRQYQRYANYPQLGFNFLIGLRYELNK